METKTKANKPGRQLLATFTNRKAESVCSPMGGGDQTHYTHVMAM